MSKIVLHILFCVLSWCEAARSQHEHDVKRGVYPFMAVLYYPDETVVDITGIRFQHGAVLIKPEWLLSAAIDHSALDGNPLGFPRKTLVARMGAITLDTNYTFNEDEDEQEREVIQIIKPSNHNKEMWWITDITLLQTLIPFKISSSVAPTNIDSKREYEDKNCLILVYAEQIGKPSDEKTLTQVTVELLPPSVDNCGAQFNDTTMTCAVPGDESKNVYHESEFCQGNSGGPLICEGEVMALQTYIENNCKPPHLYQLLAAWDAMITCGTEQKCGVDLSCNVCVAIHKDMTADEPSATTTTFFQSDSTFNQNETDTTEQPSTGTETQSSEETDIKTTTYSTTTDGDYSPETTESKESSVTSKDTHMPTTLTVVSESMPTTLTVTSENMSTTSTIISKIMPTTSTNMTDSTIITTVSSKEDEFAGQDSLRRMMNSYDIFKEYNSEKVSEHTDNENIFTSLAPTTVTSPNNSHRGFPELPKFRVQGRRPHLSKKHKKVKQTKRRRGKHIASLRAAGSTHAIPNVFSVLIVACLIERFVFC